MMKTFATVLLVFTGLGLSACATYPGDAPIVENGPAAPAGTAVGLGTPVMAGPVVMTPTEIVEDSRCPTGVQCAWAGRLVVRTRIDGAGWRETVDLTAGQDRQVRAVQVILYEALPAPHVEHPIAPDDYRLKFDAMVPAS